LDKITASTLRHTIKPNKKFSWKTSILAMQSMKPSSDTNFWEHMWISHIKISRKILGVELHGKYSIRFLKNTKLHVYTLMNWTSKTVLGLSLVARFFSQELLDILLNSKLWPMMWAFMHKTPLRDMWIIGWVGLRKHFLH
jgi:hypothetical protein